MPVTPKLTIEYLRDVTGWRSRGRALQTTLNRDVDLVLGTHRPGISGYSGLVDESLLVPVAAATTSFTSANNGQTISDKAYNQIKLSGVQNLTFRNCLVRGLTTTPGVDGELVIATNAANANNTFIDCLFEPQNPYWLARLGRAHGIKLIRCEARRMSDGFAANNSAGYDATVNQQIDFRQCWFHDSWLGSPDPGSAGGQADNMSHVDVVAQIMGGSGFYFGGNEFNALLGAGLENVGTQITSFTDQTPLRAGSDGYRMSVDTWSGSTRTYHIRGNKYYDYVRLDGQVLNPPVLLLPYPQYAQATSLFMFSSALGGIGAGNGGCIIEKNWMDGGAVGINFGDYNSPGFPVVSPGALIIRDNRWGPVDGSAPPSFRLGPTQWGAINNAIPGTFTGNIRTDTGAAMNAH